MTDQHRHVGVMARIALLVAVGDWLTKAAAARAVTGESLVFSEKLRFAVVHNGGAVFGWDVGVYTWQLNLALTLAAIVLMVPVTRELARIDAAAPRALGLIVGGALGNFGSLVFSPPGVVDFISISVGTASELVVNVADVAAYIGLAMVTRTGFLIVAEIRRTARAGKSIHKAPWWGAEAATAGLMDREVSLPVAFADRPLVEVEEVTVPRPESVRRTELADALEAISDPKVIDIRPRLAQQRPPVQERRADM